MPLAAVLTSVLGASVPIQESDEAYGLLAASRPPARGAVVSQLMEDALAGAGPVLQRWFWPDARPFCLALSHDVDDVQWSWRRRLLMAARRPETLRERGHYWNFERVHALEHGWGVRSSWYFVADGRHPRDPPYRLADVADVMQRLVRDGHEVGVHGSFESYRDAALLRRERAAVEAASGQPVRGVRQHWLNFDAGTWQVQEAAGFGYDATVGCNEEPGFRAGFCHPYRLAERRIHEIPLILMDGQLFMHSRLRPEAGLDLCRSVAAEVMRRHGVLTLNWHQHTYDGLSFPGWWDVYERLVPDLLAHGPVTMTHAQVWQWWRAREGVHMTLVRRRGRAQEHVLTSPRPVAGFALRVANAPDASLEADVPARTVEAPHGRFMVLDLPADEPVNVRVAA